MSDPRIEEFFDLEAKLRQSAIQYGESRTYANAKALRLAAVAFADAVRLVDGALMASGAT